MASPSTTHRAAISFSTILLHAAEPSYHVTTAIFPLLREAGFTREELIDFLSGK